MSFVRIVASSLRRVVKVQPSNFRRISVAAPFASQIRMFSSPHSVGSSQTTFLDRKDVVSRVLEVVKKFPKVDVAKVTATAAFTNDLGLDSLDQVELVMAIEDEFKVEISDAEAEKILSIEDAVKYMTGHPKAQ